MIKSTLSKEFLLAMVCAMYKYEAHEVRNLDMKLLSDIEMEDFYNSYMGISL
jgi:hypothetical protein